jgi:hypothetical protein
MSASPHPGSTARIFCGILFTLICVVIPELALFLYLNRTTGVAISVNSHPAGSDTSSSSGDRQELQIIPVEVPISGIEESIVRARPAGFILRARRDYQLDGGRTAAFYDYWDGRGWANYEAAAEIFSQRNLAEEQLKGSPLPRDGGELEVVETPSVK